MSGGIYDRYSKLCFDELKQRMRIMDTKLKHNELLLYKGRYLSVSNEYLTARTIQTGLLEAKTEMMSMVKLANDCKLKTKKDAEGKDYSVQYIEISANEMRKITNSTRGDFYKALVKVGIALKQKVHLTFDASAKTFKIRSIYNGVTYENGKLIMEFDPESADLVKNLSTNYTKIPLDTIFSLQTYGGFNMYKIFEKEMHRLPEADLDLPQEKQEAFMLEFNLNDFRYQLGFLDMSQDELKKEVETELLKGPYADFERMNTADKSPKYPRFNDLKKRVIDPGIAELNEKTDIYIANMERQMQGYGGKITGVIFTIQRNVDFYCKKKGKQKVSSASSVSKEVSDLTPQQAKALKVIKNMISADLSEKDYLAIAKAADFKISVVGDAVDILFAQTGVVNNVTGFLIAAIKNGYEPATQMVKENSFSQPEFFRNERSTATNEECIEFNDMMEKMRSEFSQE